MIMHQSKLVGILGGMGPEATAAFFYKIIKNTPAQKDQDHLRILIYNNPTIPDRTSSIFGNGESPVKALIESAHFLEDSGCDLLAIPCVTSHVFYRELQSAVKIPIMNIVDETLKYVRLKLPKVTRIGLLATSGTIRCGLFKTVCDSLDLNVIMPSAEDQAILMDAIYGEGGIKAGDISEMPKKNILHVSDTLIRNGAEIMIGGCTEISLVINSSDLSVPFIDTLEVLAIATVGKAMDLS
jgi:aspartate racemase